MAGSVDFELHPGGSALPPAPDFAVAPAAAPAVAAEVPAQPAAPELRATPLPARPHWLLARTVDFALLMRLDRPIGIWLLLWPTLWALWIAAGGHPQPRLVAIFIAGTVLMRSAGCIINDLLDRNIDPQVRRTRERPLASRRVAPVEAVALFVVLLVAALLLVLQLNALSLRLAFIGAALTVTYPLFKRFFPLPQLYLGLSFGWGIPMAFAAELGQVPRVGWVLMLAAVVWAGVYDTFYAMADRPDDVRIGLKSSAITFGDLDLTMIGAMQALVLLALLFCGRLLDLSAPYYGALAAGAVCFAWQQWLARGRDAPGCLRAFHNNNYFGIVVLAGVILEYAARR
jgi:4-hydroxybenzoate polyprenyltransferase